MGRPINNIRKAALRVKINKAGYKTLSNLANTVVLRMTGNAAFTTPSPSLTSLTTAASDMADAARFMGQKRNRGSKTELQDAKAKALQLRSLLTAMLQYVINTAQVAAAGNVPTYDNIIASSGFAIKDARRITPSPQIARFVTQSNSKKYPGTLHRLDWSRPIGMIKGAKVAGYNIIIGGIITQTVTATHAIIPVNPTLNTDVEIQPFNSRGVGASFFATIK